MTRDLPTLILAHIRSGESASYRRECPLRTWLRHTLIHQCASGGNGLSRGTSKNLNRARACTRWRKGREAREEQESPLGEAEGRTGRGRAREEGSRALAVAVDLDDSRNIF